MVTRNVGAERSGGPWIMKQRWHDVLFAHWEVAAPSIQKFIPDGMQLDTYEGRAFIGVIPFRMSGIRARGLPPIPGTSAFMELNVRTYVTVDGQPGVYFFSLDAAHWLAVKMARMFFHLPYYEAKMSMYTVDDQIEYHSVRKLRGPSPIASASPSVDGAYQFRAKYRPLSPPFTAEEGTLTYWLTERYRLYTTVRNRIYRCDIVHRPWLLQQAEAQFAQHNMYPPLRNVLQTRPISVLFSQEVEVQIGMLRKARSST